MRVAAVAMHSAMGEPAANLDRVERWLRRAKHAGARFAVFPEECITGSVNKSELADDAVLAAIDTAAELAVPRLEALCRELGMTAVVGTVERRGDRRLQQCADRRAGRLPRHLRQDVAARRRAASTSSRGRRCR